MAGDIRRGRASSARSFRAAPIPTICPGSPQVVGSRRRVEFVLSKELAMKSDSRWRSLLTTLAVAVGLGGAAPAARAAPCEPPLTLDECDLLVASSATNSVLRYDGATGDFL